MISLITQMYNVATVLVQAFLLGGQINNRREPVAIDSILRATT
jgi:hypothetical protein